MDPDVRQLADDPPAEIVPGVVMRGVWGERGMLNVIELAPGAEVRPHSHPHEQLGYVLEGEITMTVAGVTDTWHAGVAYAIPGGVEHAAVAGPGGCRVIDVFIPVREEYRDKLVAAGR